MTELRPYQTEVIAQYRAAIASGSRRILLVAPTGSGKTTIGGAIIKETVTAGGRVLTLKHRRELVSQWADRLYKEDIDFGVLLPDHPTRLYAPVQVASILTLHARAIVSNRIDLPEANLVVVDEAHHTRARTYTKILERYPNSIILGLTATPCRGDGRGLGNMFDTMIQCPQVGELIESGFLVKTKVYAPSTPDLKGIRVERGDYVESDLASRVNTDRLVGDIIEHWFRLGGRRKTVVFATGVAHSKHIRDEFRRADVMAEHIDGTTPTEERDRILAQLSRGEIDVITNAMVLTEGWDQPSVSCLVLARPTKSMGLYRQMTGRVLRPAEGKTDALILDHAGATFMHGFAEDPIDWFLSEDHRAENKTHAARGTGEMLGALTNCPECSAVMMRGKSCPACGWRPQRKAKAIAVADGELGEVQRDRTVRPGEWSDQQKVKFHRELLWLGREKSYKPGWAAMKFKEKFGVWPAAKPWELPPPEMPSPATRSWVRSRQIAYAKAMQAHDGAT